MREEKETVKEKQSQERRNDHNGFRGQRGNELGPGVEKWVKGLWEISKVDDSYEWFPGTYGFNMEGNGGQLKDWWVTIWGDWSGGGLLCEAGRAVLKSEQSTCEHSTHHQVLQAVKLVLLNIRAQLFSFCYIVRWLSHKSRKYSAKYFSPDPSTHEFEAP